MRMTKLMAASLTAALALSGAAWAADEAKTEKAQKSDKAEKSGRHGGKAGGKWMLGMQAWTFHNDTLFEAIDQTKELGLHYIELIPNQALSPEAKDVKFNENSPADVVKKVQDKLKEAKVQAISYGVVGLNDEAQARKVFEFAKKMGMTTIESEPDPANIKMVDKLANEFGINVGIHNHPKEAKYWNPDTVLETIKGCSKRVGSCADTGHWVRSGLDPMECLKKLEGHIVSSHFKDLNEKSATAHDVVWGTGVCNAAELLKELNRQGFHGPIMIEYEYNWGKAMPEIKQCIEFFGKTMKELHSGGHGKAKESKTEEKK